VKRFQNRSDVFEFWSLDNSSSKSILDVLETIYLFEMLSLKIPLLFKCTCVYITLGNVSVLKATIEKRQLLSHHILGVRIVQQQGGHIELCKNCRMRQLP